MERRNFFKAAGALVASLFIPLKADASFIQESWDDTKRIHSICEWDDYNAKLWNQNKFCIIRLHQTCLKTGKVERGYALAPGKPGIKGIHIMDDKMDKWADLGRCGVYAGDKLETQSELNGLQKLTLLRDNLNSCDNAAIHQFIMAFYDHQISLL